MTTARSSVTVKGDGDGGDDEKEDEGEDEGSNAGERESTAASRMPEQRR